MLTGALMLFLAGTPVSVQVDLSDATRARLGPQVRDLTEQQLDAATASEPPKDPPLHLTAGLRVGVLVRPPSVDPTLAFHGAIPGGLVEPVGLMGVTFAPGPGLTAWEVPLAAGIRLPIALSSWRPRPWLQSC